MCELSKCVCSVHVCGHPAYAIAQQEGHLMLRVVIVNQESMHPTLPCAISFLVLVITNHKLQFKKSIINMESQVKLRVRQHISSIVSQGVVSHFYRLSLLPASSIAWMHAFHSFWPSAPGFIGHSWKTAFCTNSKRDGSRASFPFLPEQLLVIRS